MAAIEAQSDDKVMKNRMSYEESSVQSDIKKEGEVAVKPEPVECIVCLVRSKEILDIYSTTTSGSGSSIHVFLAKFGNSNFEGITSTHKFICKSCYDLVNVLEQAEIEYMKLKETFETIISKNPLFESQTLQKIQMDAVKNEMLDLSPDTEHMGFDDYGMDSEDEPLAVTKKKRRKPLKRKKKSNTFGKRKTRSKEENEENESWECNECGIQSKTGGLAAEHAHRVTVHGEDERESSYGIVKKEENSDGSQCFSNGFDTLTKIESGDYEDDDDNSSNYVPDEEIVVKRKVGRPLKSKNSTVQKVVKKRERVIHKCDQCDAKYSSLVRLEQHKLKHDGSKPPYICEVCGAHYKHKRACDIHIALHNGISDWKCEECNKLFPSKGALARHNNIHTGKLNYQCDLCGKSFIHTSSFKMHKLSHSGVKPHACDVCGLALMTRSHLKRHKRVHSGEKRHECTVCGKRFSERYNLVAHSKSHEAAGAPPPAPRRHFFRCTFCPDRFERRYLLERHMSAVHGRALERPPPTPRNTMSKLLKAQAGRRHEADKDERSSDSRSAQVTPQKLIAQLAAPGAASSWSSAYTEFNLRTDFQH